MGKQTNVSTYKGSGSTLKPTAVRYLVCAPAGRDPSSDPGEWRAELKPPSYRVLSDGDVEKNAEGIF